MIGLLQRVSAASVEVDGAPIAAIGRGLLVLVGVEAGDGEGQADRLLERLLGYRVFPDETGRMNLSLRYASHPIRVNPTRPEKIPYNSTDGRPERSIEPAPAAPI